MVDDPKTKPWRLKFSIATLLFFTTMVALGVGWWREKQQHARTQIMLGEQMSMTEEYRVREDFWLARIPTLQLKAVVDSLPDPHRLRNQGQFEDALDVLKRTHEAQKRYLGVEHPQAIESLLYIGELYSLIDKPDDAAPYLVDYIENARDGPKIHLATALNHLGDVRLRQSRFGEAEPFLRECLALKRETQPDHWTVASTESSLGACLVAQGRLAGAEPLLIAGYEGLRARASKIWQRQRASGLSSAAERLVTLYDEWGKPSEAAKWRREWERTKEQYEETGSEESTAPNIAN